MLLEKNKYCKCPNCGCMSFKDVSIVNVIICKDGWKQDILMPEEEQQRFKCTRCGKEFSDKELYEHYCRE